MPSFEDKKGHRWTVEFTVGTAKRAKSLLEADFLAPPSEDRPSPILRLDTDAWFLVDMLFLVCEDQAEGPPLNVDADEFAERLSGGPLKDAHDALMEALEHFFQSLGRKPLVEMIRRQREILTQAMAVGARKIKGATVDRVITREMEALDRRMDAAIDSTRGSSSTSSPVPSESTPTPLPSEA